MTPLQAWGPSDDNSVLRGHQAQTVPVSTSRQTETGSLPDVDAEGGSLP